MRFGPVLFAAVITETSDLAVYYLRRNPKYRDLANVCHFSWRELIACLRGSSRFSPTSTFRKRIVAHNPRGGIFLRRKCMARSSAASRPLTDHQEIRSWAEERGAKPACVRGTGSSNDIGMIRLDFPGYSGEGSLEEISWDEWFQKFDDSNLALLVQNQTADGQQSNFNKLVSQETAGLDEVIVKNHPLTSAHVPRAVAPRRLQLPPELPKMKMNLRR